MALNFIEHVLILVTGCISISVSAFLLGILIGITISAIGLNICAITAEIKKYKSIIKKKKKRHDKLVLSAKTNMKVLIFKALIDSNINHDVSKKLS